MNAIIFSKRTTKEILRDPLTLFFGLGFPVILLILLSAIQKNVPVSLFEINSLAPAMTIFGLSFMTLFASLLISKELLIHIYILSFHLNDKSLKLNVYTYLYFP